MKQPEITTDFFNRFLDGTHSIQTALSAPFVDPLSRTYWLGLVVMLPITILYYYIKRPNWSRESILSALRNSSTWLDVQMLVARQLLNLLIGTQALVSAWYIATRGTRLFDDIFGVGPRRLPRLRTVDTTTYPKQERQLYHRSLHRPSPMLRRSQ